MSWFAMAGLLILTYVLGAAAFQFVIYRMSVVMRDCDERPPQIVNRRSQVNNRGW